MKLHLFIKINITNYVLCTFTSNVFLSHKFLRLNMDISLCKQL